MRVKKRYWIMYAVLFLFIGIVSGAGIYRYIMASKPDQIGLFSWDMDSSNGAYAEQLFSFMDQLGITSVYQSFPKNEKDAEIVTFLKKAVDREKSVYYLTGNAKWAIRENDNSMLNEIERVASLNRMSKKTPFKGIVMDVEPYVTSAWKKDQAVVMQRYVNRMIEAYMLANKNGLEFIACIPYHYDNQGQKDELERLIAEGCDGIAIMNYNKHDECGQIETEISLAKKYDKFVINIYELQKPGKHELTENNTYYREGIAGVKESWNRLRHCYAYRYLGYAYHDYNALKEIVEYE